MLNNLQGVLYSLENHLYTHKHTHRHTWWHVINIVSCRGSYHGGVHQLLSLEQQMCGRYSRGKGYMAHNTIDQNLSGCLYACVCVCVLVYMCT